MIDSKKKLFHFCYFLVLLIDLQTTQIASTMSSNSSSGGWNLIKLEEEEGSSCSCSSSGNLFYRCKHCHTYLALASDILSKAFLIMNGKAYLFDHVVNVTFGVKEERMLITGMHDVRDIYCVKCKTNLGLKYEVAPYKTQKYKEGKFLVERTKISVFYGANDEDDA